MPQKYKKWEMDCLNFFSNFAPYDFTKIWVGEEASFIVLEINVIN